MVITFGSKIMTADTLEKLTTVKKQVKSPVGRYQPGSEGWMLREYRNLH